VGGGRRERKTPVRGCRRCEPLGGVASERVTGSREGEGEWRESE